MDHKVAFGVFTRQMRTKLELRAKKYEDKSITRTTPVAVFTWDEMWIKFESEVKELRDAPHDQSEMVDVANMAFILWWFQQESKNDTQLWITTDDDGEID